jgi:hypothetical protein
MEKLYPDFNYELIKSLLIEVQKMLMALIKKLQSTMTK